MKLLAAESFNLLTPSFSNPNTTISSYDTDGVTLANVGVGQISSTAAIPRQLQFALKLLF